MNEKFFYISFGILLFSGSCASPDSDNKEIELPGTQQIITDTESLDTLTIVQETEPNNKIVQVDLSENENVSKDEKIELIKQLEFDFEFLTHGSDDWAESALDVFHFLDLDKDGDLDAIYDGWTGGEPTIVRIYLNIEEKFKRALSEVQYLTDMQINENGLAAISICDPGCCDSYVRFDEDFLVHTSKDHMSFESIKRTAIIGDTPNPSEFLAEPIPFVVEKDLYYLRSTPEIDTTELIIYENLRRSDNIIAQYEQDAHGIAYAKSTDHTSRVWWFVEMDPDFYPIETEFYDYETEATFLIGWLSSRYLSAYKDDTDEGNSVQ